MNEDRPAGPGPNDLTEQPILRRSKSDRVVAGVCGGIGRFFGIDPVLVRVVFAVLVLAGMSGILLYVVAWIVIPEEDEQGTGRARMSGSNSAGMIVGAVLVAAGTMILLDRYWPRFDDVFWPVALIAIGVAVILQGIRK